MQIKEKILQGKMSFLVDRHLSRKRTIKMLQASWPEDNVNVNMEKYTERMPGIDKGHNCCSCMSLHLPLCKT